MCIQSRIPNYSNATKMKRKNRLNVLSSSNNKKREFTIRKETVLLQQSNNDLNSSETTMEPDIPLIYRRLKFSWDCRKLWFRHSICSTEVTVRLAENWTEVRDTLYSTIISGNALQGAQCFSCQNSAAIRCLECGPFFMCWQCCLQRHENCNIHHSPEVWKVNCILQVHALIQYQCIWLQDNNFVLIKLPPVNFYSRAHACEIGHSRKVVLFHIEGKYIGYHF